MSFCAFCYHEATKELLCDTCESDRLQSEKIQVEERKMDPEYHMVAVDNYSTQEKYIQEFWARLNGEDPIKVRRSVTRSICDEMDCKPAHWQGEP